MTKFDLSLFKGGKDRIRLFGSAGPVAVTPETGSALVEVATEAVDNERKRIVLQYVMEQLKLEEEATNAIKIASAQAAYYNRTVEALNAGNFEITPQGKILFRDKDLRCGRYQPPDSIIYM
jgi:hypothetical protein